MAADGLSKVRRAVELAAVGAGRSVEEVTIVAVSKGRSVAQINELYEVGHRDFGENRAQELADKVPQLPDDIRWHFVGPLQRNKVAKVRGSLLHSLDSERLARAWTGAPALVQVNIGSEPQKQGAEPSQAAAFVDSCIGLGVEVIGLMAIPPRVTNASQARPFFRKLAAIRDEIVSIHPGVTELSMGMTEDFEVAVAEGATLVRIGRAIFDSAGD